MNRIELSFEDFKKHFLLEPDGYRPVCWTLEEDDDGHYTNVILIDMICEWRLSDGQIRFYRIPFDTVEQFREIVEYLKTCIKLLCDALMEEIPDLEVQFSEVGKQGEDA